MTFFDKKEEVMKIELTPYGRYLLSVGKLRPKYYRLFDDNIIYDSKCGGFSEPQNKVHVRVIEETPILKNNPNITGVETNIRKFDVPEVSARHLRIPSLDDAISTNIESIGTNNYTSHDSSHYQVSMFNSEFVESRMSNNYSTPNVASIAIPQLPVNFYLSASVKAEEFYDQQNNTINNFASNEIRTQAFADENYISIRNPEPILYIKEINSFDKMDNFVLTAFKIQSSSLGVTYSKLKVPEKVQKVVNGLLLNEEMASAGIFDGFGTDTYESGDTSTPEDLLYYLNLSVDREIPNEDICNAIGEMKVKNIYLDNELKCPEYEPTQEFEIYNTRVGPEDLEDCD